MESGRYWVETTGPYSPAELRRPYQERGIWLVLGDGSEWLIPNESELPRDLILEDDGSIKFELQRRFAEFGTEVDRWRERTSREIEGDSAEVYSYRELLDFATRALRVNYRITPEIVNSLRLFSTSNVMRAVFATMGIEAKNRGA